MSTLDGYEFVVDITTDSEHFDWQGHLNNVAALKLVERARIKYMTGGGLSEEARASLLNDVYIVVRELHVLYETEGFPLERYRCGVRGVSRTTKSFVLEQVLVEAAHERPVVRVWAVLLFVARTTGRVTEAPAWFWERVAQIEGRDIPWRDRTRVPWGPPAD